MCQTIDELETEIREKGLDLGRVIQSAIRAAGRGEVSVEDAKNGYEFGVRISGLGKNRKQEDYWMVQEGILQRAEKNNVYLNNENLHTVAGMLENPFGNL
ncbi:MAG: hypothetical protein M1514_00260 [Patescibacteria group bacterium]|nr:hypothetical protein [Patescibacteria group bacterium]